MLANGDRQDAGPGHGARGLRTPLDIDVHLRLGPLDAAASRALLTATAGSTVIEDGRRRGHLVTLGGCPALRRGAHPGGVRTAKGRREWQVRGAADAAGRAVEPARPPRRRQAHRPDRRRLRSPIPSFRTRPRRRRQRRPAARPGARTSLVAAGIMEAGSAPDLFKFRHALIQEVAYETMLRSTRRNIHDRIANAVRSSDRGPTIASLALVAQHLHLAGRRPTPLRHGWRPRNRTHGARPSARPSLTATPGWRRSPR